MERVYFKKLKTILQSKFLFKVLCAFSLVYSFFVINFFPFQSKYQGDETNLEGVVTKYQFGEEKVMFYVRDRETVIVNYYFKSESDKEWLYDNLKLGQKIACVGVLKEPSKNTIPNLFNYKMYLKYKKIFYLMNANSLEVKKENTSVFYEIKNRIIKRIELIDDTGYLKTFLLGDKSDLEDQSVELYQKNGVSHLFSISGMHVSFLTGILLLVLRKFTYNNRYCYGVIGMVLIFYLFLTDVSASILRTVVMFFVFSINKCFGFRIRTFDLMLFVLTICLVINPFLICDVGFQFSYIISISLILEKKYLTCSKRKFIQNFKVAVLCFLVSLPISLYHFGQINVLSIFFNLIMIPLVSSIIFPMTFLVFCIPNLYFVYDKGIFVLEKINILFSELDCFQFVFAKPSLLVVFLYFSLVFLSFWRRKVLVFLIFVLCIHKFYPYFDGKFLMTVLDVGQGDAIFIKFPYHQGNILIDTGGITGGESVGSISIANDKLIPYLYSLGITKLDYLIFTHGDSDHMGESIDFVNCLKVEQVVFNNDSYNELEQKLIKILNKKKIKYYKNIKEININGTKLQFLSTGIYDNENDNSNVIYFSYRKFKFLLMGDASVEREKDILDKYELKDIDVLKVGHHGSKTSSSEEFIDHIAPRYSVISVGKNNRYGHPNEEVIENLKDTIVYRTDRDGSIIFEIFQEKYKVYSSAP